AEPGVVGIAEIRSEAHPDPSQFDPKSDYYDPASKREEPRWLLVDVGYKRKLKRTITLAELKDKPQLQDLALVKKGNRLSVMPVSKSEWDYILSLE
ncbi:MAG TPA: EVE domain-containing protein, partial [Tahibacter sp.]|nr:EVE domain-containing protein [Tahibacter sp.]